MDIWSTLKSKAGPLPIWAWTLGGVITLALYLTHKKQTSGQTKAAADQTNSDLGSAAELANMFNIAGLMPYQGGNVYVNTTETQNPPSSPSKPSGGGTVPVHSEPGPPYGKPGGNPPTKGAPAPRAVYTVKHNDTLGGIAAKYGLDANTLFKYNTTPGVRPAATEATLKKRGKNLIYANEKILIPPKGYK